MPIRWEELIEAAEILAEKEEMKVTMKYSFAGAAFTAITTLVGGVVGGPLGLGVGGAFGGITSSLYTKRKFKSMLTIIKEELSVCEKQRLAEHLERAIQDFQITDLAKLLLLLRSNEALYFEMVKAIKYFIENDMHRSIMQ